MTAKIIPFNCEKTPDSPLKFNREAADGIVEYLQDFTARCNALTENLEEDIEVMKRIVTERK